MSRPAGRCFALRHGQSLANERGIIVSDPHTAGVAWGLTDTGREQVRASIAGCDEFAGAPRIISSPLLRARESAEIARKILGCEAVVIDARLRERGFGRLEGGSDARYAEVWAQDAIDEACAPHAVEPAQQVRERVSALLDELRLGSGTQDVLLVAHGDTIQILWTVFAGLGAGEHRRFGALRPGQLLALGEFIYRPFADQGRQ